MRIAPALFGLVFSGGLFWASAQVQQQPIRVYVVAAGEGAAANAASHSALDVARALGSRAREFQVVKAQSEAELLVRVDSRRERHGQTSVSSEIDPSHSGGRASAVRDDREARTYVLEATLIAGNQEVPLEQEAEGSWRAATNAMAARVSQWVRENRPRSSP